MAGLWPAVCIGIALQSDQNRHKKTPEPLGSRVQMLAKLCLATFDDETHGDTKYHRGDCEIYNPDHVMVTPSQCDNHRQSR